MQQCCKRLERLLKYIGNRQPGRGAARGETAEPTSDVTGDELGITGRRESVGESSSGRPERKVEGNRMLLMRWRIEVFRK